MRKQPATPGTLSIGAGKPTRSPSRIRQSQSGQSLVEMALVTPLLLAMLLGAVEIGRYAYLSILVGNAAHAGAMYGAQSLTQSVYTAGIQQAADNDFQNNGQSVGNLTVSSSASCGCDSGGTLTPEVCSTVSSPGAGTCTTGANWVVMVSVTATSTFRSLFSYPWIPSSITVSRTATMRVAGG